MSESQNHPEAKPLSDLLWENRLEWDEWLRLGVTENKHIQLAPKYQSKWLPVAVHNRELEKQQDAFTKQISYLKEDAQKLEAEPKRLAELLAEVLNQACEYEEMMEVKVKELEADFSNVSEVAKFLQREKERFEIAQENDGKIITHYAGQIVKLEADRDEWKKLQKETKANLEFQSGNVEKWNNYAKKYLEEIQNLKDESEDVSDWLRDCIEKRKRLERQMEEVKQVISTYSEEKQETLKILNEGCDLANEDENSELCATYGEDGISSCLRDTCPLRVALQQKPEETEK